MSEFIYFGDHQMFRKLKELYNVSIPKNNSEKKQSFKSKKKTCLENISFMFKENHFQFPPRLNQNNNKNYHGSKSQFGTNVLFEKLKVFKNVIGILTWNGDEFFPSQTLTLFDLNRSESIVHILELTEDEMINEKIVDFQIGDDFIVCQTESSQLYFIGLYTNQSTSNTKRADINYYCEPMPCEKMGRVEWVKCSMKQILIKTVSQNFYVAKVQKLNSTPKLKPINFPANNSTMFDGFIGEGFSSFVGTSPTATAGNYIYVNYNTYLFLNKERILANNSTMIIKDNSLHYLNNAYGITSGSIDSLILNAFPEEHSHTIQDFIVNPSGDEYLFLVSFESGKKSLVIFSTVNNYTFGNQHLDFSSSGTILYFHTNVYRFPAYFYSITGFDEDVNLEKCHFTNDFILFEKDSIQKGNFFTKLAKNTRYVDVELVTQNDGEQ